MSKEVKRIGVRHWLPAFIAIALGGCGSLLDAGKVDYKSATKLPPLEVPPDLTAPGKDDRYAVPEVGSKSGDTFSNYKGERGGPAAGKETVLPTAANAHVERDGSQRWLVVNGDPQSLWPKLKQFWQDSGFTLAVDMPQAGVMETDWAENRAKIPQDFIRRAIGSVLDGIYSTPERDKYRTRIEAGTAPGTTEIYVSHHGLYEIYTNEGHSETRWQPRPPDPDLEAEMLQRMVVRLGVDETRAKAIVEQAKEAPEKAKLSVAADGGNTLLVEEPFDRTWRRVGLALDRVGFTVEDRDRSQGLYFVRYVDLAADAKKEDEKGFLSKLAFWESDKPGETGKPQYRIHVKGDAATSTVEVLAREGGVDKSESARKVLSLLYEQLK